MKSQELHDELKIREKIQDLKTPVQDADWQKMLALLESDTTEGGGTPVPEAPKPSPAASGSKRRYLLWIFLSVTALGAWWASGQFPARHHQGVPEQSPDKGALSGVSKEQNSSAFGPASPPAGPANTDKQQAQTSALQTLNEAPINAEQGIYTQAKTKEPSDKSGSKSARAPQTPLSGADFRQTDLPGNKSNAGTSKSSDSPVFNSLSAADAGFTAAETLASKGLSPLDKAQDLLAPEAAAALAAAQMLRTFGALLPLPQSESALAWQMAGPDTLIRPAERHPRKARRFQRGMILGGNLNVVNYEARRLSIMPHLGYHISAPLTRDYRFQAEVQFKYVSNYQETAEFKYVSPGNVLDIRWEMNNLFFIEMPLLLKQENKGIGKTSWLAGVKPAWCTPIFPTGSNSSSGSGFLPGPQVNLDLRDGVRQFDLGLVLGMDWRFARSWALDLRYNQGMLDLTHDNFFKDNTTHLNCDVQLTLRHYVRPYKYKRHAKHNLYPEPVRAD